MKTARVAFTELEELLSACPETSKSYLLTEGAKVANLVHYLDGFELDHACLFDGEAYETFSDEAPYLVALDDRPSQAEDFLWEILQDGNGVVLFSELNLNKLKVQLKKQTYGLVEGVHAHIRFFTAKNFHYVLETVDGFRSLFDNVDMAVLSAVDLSDDFVTLKG